MVAFYDIIKIVRQAMQGRVDFMGDTHQGVGQITAWVLDILNTGESADLAKENGRRKI